MISKVELIESIEKWAPGKSSLGDLLSKTIEELKDILAAAVEDFTEEQQERVLAAQADTAATRFAHELGVRETRKPIIYAEKQALEKENRAVFAVVSRQLGFSGIEANYSILVDALGELTLWGIQKWISERPETLAPATPAELQQYEVANQAEFREREAARIKAHNKMLLNADPITLKKLARSEAEQRRVQAQREHVQQQIQSREAVDATQGYPVLPAVNQTTGERLDAAYFIKLSNTDMQLYKSFMRRYGASQITKALNERI